MEFIDLADLTISQLEGGLKSPFNIIGGERPGDDELVSNLRRSEETAPTMVIYGECRGRAVRFVIDTDARGKSGYMKWLN